MFLWLYLFLNFGLLNATLLLTPYIEQGKFKEARDAASVAPLVPGVQTSYSGYITIDPRCDANIFFWFFPADTNWETAPTTVWLQGGPGMTGLFGAFYEHGPVELTIDGKLKKREFSWTRKANVLYTDSPVGSGYSYAKKECYSKTDQEVTENLKKFLEQFFKLFSELQKNKMFLFGEAYASRVALLLSEELDKNPTGFPKIDGLAFGNAIMDPVFQMQYGETLHRLGFIDTKAKEHFLLKEKEFKTNVEAGDLVAACSIYYAMILDPNALFYNYTGYHHYYNYLDHGPETRNSAILQKYFQTSHVPEALHVGLASFSLRQEVMRPILDHFAYSLTEILQRVLEKHRVLLYDGQMDLALTHFQTSSHVETLKWSGAKAYKNAPRKFWRVGKDLAGYTKSAGKLTEVLVRNAGLFVPMDQPEWTFDMYQKFIDNKPIA